MALTCLLAALAMQGQEPAALAKKEASITFQTDGLLLAKAIPELGVLAKEKWAVSPALAGEPVVISVENVEVAELKEKLAHVFHATWSRRNEIEVLERTPAIQERLIAERRAKRAKAVTESIERLIKEQEEIKPLTAAGAKEVADELEAVAATYKELETNPNQGLAFATEKRRLAATRRLPGRRLYTAIVTALGIETITNIRDGRVVFSLNPTPMQRPLPGEALTALETYEAERAIVYAEFSKRPPGGNQTNVYWEAGNPWEPPKKVADAHLIIRADDLSGFSSSHLTLFDGSGQRIADENGTFDMSFDPEEFMAERQKAAEAGAAQEPLDLPPIIQELAKRRQSPTGLPPLSPEALAAVANPERVDPLALGYSQFMSEIARVEGRNLVATAADSASSQALTAARTNPPKAAVFEQAVSRFGYNTVEREEGWLIGRSSDPILMEASRAKRAALGPVIRTFVQEGFIPLDLWANFAWHSPSEGVRSAVQLAKRVISGQQGETNLPDWDALRFYGSLGGIQRSQLLQGGTLRLAELTNEQRQLVDRMVFWNHIGLTEKGPNASRPRRDFSSDPTVALPNGLPKTTQCTMTETSAMAVFVKNDRRLGLPARESSFENAAGMMAMHERPDLFPWVNGDFDNWFNIGHQRTVKLSFDFGTSVELRTELDEQQIPSSPSLTAAQIAERLGEPNGTKFMSHLNRSREQFKKMTPDDAARMNPGSAPPPP